MNKEQKKRILKDGKSLSINKINSKKNNKIMPEIENNFNNNNCVNSNIKEQDSNEIDIESQSSSDSENTRTQKKKEFKNEDNDLN